MRRVRLLAAAAEEAVAAAHWYEQQQPGLGADFDRAVQTALDLFELDVVPLHVLANAGRGSRLRRLTLSRFPYDIIVDVDADLATIVAFVHHARRPGFWRDRIRD